MNPNLPVTITCNTPLVPPSSSSKPLGTFKGWTLRHAAEPAPACNTAEMKSPGILEQKKNWWEKWSELKKEGRAVKRISYPYRASNILIYYSRNGKVNKNGVLKRPNPKDPPPVCRHLAQDHVEGKIGRFKEAGGNKYEAVMKEPCERIVSDDDLWKKINQKSPIEAHYFKLRNLTVALKSIANEVWGKPGEVRKSYLFDSSIHSMAIHVERSGEMLKISFYDPNDTWRHKQFVMSHPDQIEALCINDFLTESEQEDYFGDAKQETTSCLVSADMEKNRNNCQVNCYGEIDNFFLPMRYGHYGHPSIPSGCHAVSCLGLSGIYVALQRGHALAVRDYLSDNLAGAGECNSPGAQLIPIPHSEALMGLRCGIYFGKFAAVSAYIQGILNSGLGQHEKCRFLLFDTDNVEHKKKLKYFTKKMDRFPAFQIYANMIQKSDLDDRTKSLLIGKLRNHTIERKKTYV